jgi:hypothetical protein
MAGGDLSDGEIYDAVEQTKGNLGAAARILGVRRSIVAKRVETKPELAALLEDFRQSVIDTAEDNVHKDVEKGDPTASRFVLQSIGKDRGYSVGVAGTGKGGSIVVELKSFDGAADAERQ